MDQLELNRIYCMDCFDGLPLIPDESVDLICVDLPYGVTTRNSWDHVLPMNDYIVVDGKRMELNEWLFGKTHQTVKFRSKNLCQLEEKYSYFEKNKKPGLWKHYERIIKPNGAVILFGAGMFTSYLMQSNPKLWRYNIIWKKTAPVGFLNANKMPLRAHEDICVFYKKLPVYHPQKTKDHPPVNSYTKHTSDGTNYGQTKLETSGGGSTERYPISVWEYPSDKQREHYHPTQKPLALIKNIILTYTDENMTVLDHCSGSGTVAVAAMETNRNFICMENFETYYEDSILRLEKHKENRSCVSENSEPGSERKER